MKKLTEKRIKEILTDFCSKWFYNSVFDEGFMETTYGCEEEMIDDDSDSMKECLIENYLLWYGYDYVLQENDTYPTQSELIDQYLKIIMYCPNCLEKIQKEKRIYVEYPYECVGCEENFYEFELIKEKKN